MGKVNADYRIFESAEDFIDVELEKILAMESPMKEQQFVEYCFSHRPQIEAFWLQNDEPLSKPEFLS